MLSNHICYQGLFPNEAEWEHEYSE